ASRALLETRQIVFLVRAVDAIIVEPETDHEAVAAERLLEGCDYRDRGTGAHEYSRTPPFIGEGFRCGTHGCIVGIERDRCACLFARELSLTVARKSCAHEIFNSGQDVL